MDDVLTAVIADDEPLLSQAVTNELARLWPELSIVETAANGPSAIKAIMLHQPDIAFLDIRMPGATGIEVAEAIAEQWTDDTTAKAPPLIVFVTAFDDYAVDAFNAAAIDYVLKPVNSERLETTVIRLKQRLQLPASHNIELLSAQIKQLLETEQSRKPDAAAVTQPLRIIRASVGDIVRMIPLEDVILFESADKYVSVYTQEHETLIRESLRNLLPQLDRNQFAQIHRGAIVNLGRVEAAVKDDTGKLTLRLRGLDKKPVVSRVYRHLFHSM